MKKILLVGSIDQHHHASLERYAALRQAQIIRSQHAGKHSDEAGYIIQEAVREGANYIALPHIQEERLPVRNELIERLGYCRPAGRADDSQIRILVMTRIKGRMRYKAVTFHGPNELFYVQSSCRRPRPLTRTV